MSDQPGQGIGHWRPDSRQEPTVRIGAVLSEDATASIEMRVPEEDYELSSAARPGRTVRNATLCARRDPGGVGVAVNEETWQAATSWRLTPRRSQTPRRGEGVLVRDVVAGRGFHWQKRVDQTLAGTIELVAGAGGLVLINELPLESYLASVITSEMSSQCPGDFLRAQCITARSWLLAFTEPKHDHEPFDRCNDDCCQRYQGTGDMGQSARDAAESTRGMVLIAPDGRVVDANYSKSCGGVVELPEHVWGVHKPGLGPLVDAPAESDARRFLPVNEANLQEYLSGDWLKQTDVYCSPRIVPEDQLGKYLGRVDESGRYFRWTVRYAHDELVAMLKGKEPKLGDMNRLTDLRVTKRGISGRATEIAVDYVNAAGQPRELAIPDQYRIRQMLHKSFLFSSAFAVEIERDGSNRCQAVTLRGAGWGHGAGLCQIGALGMALRGIGHEQIVKHYFPGAELKRLYGRD